MGTVPDFQHVSLDCEILKDQAYFPIAGSMLSSHRTLSE